MLFMMCQIKHASYDSCQIRTFYLSFVSFQNENQLYSHGIRNCQSNVVGLMLYFDKYN